MKMSYLVSQYTQTSTEFSVTRIGNEGATRSTSTLRNNALFLSIMHGIYRICFILFVKRVYDSMSEPIVSCLRQCEWKIGGNSCVCGFFFFSSVLSLSSVPNEVWLPQLIWNKPGKITFTATLIREKRKLRNFFSML